MIRIDRCNCHQWNDVTNVMGEGFLSDTQLQKSIRRSVVAKINVFWILTRKQLNDICGKRTLFKRNRNLTVLCNANFITFEIANYVKSEICWIVPKQMILPKLESQWQLFPTTYCWNVVLPSYYWCVPGFNQQVI